jgi:Protein of unknown function (DUF3276)
MYNNNSSSYNNFSNEIFSQEVYAGRNRSYFIIIKQDKNGEMYLTIKELKFNMDGTKEVHRVMIFQADFGNFLVGMQKAVEFIKSENPKAIAIRTKPTFKEQDHDENDSIPTIKPVVANPPQSAPAPQPKPEHEGTTISTKDYKPAPTIIQPKQIIEEPTPVDSNVVTEVRAKLPEKEVVTFDDLDDLLEMN